MKKQTIRAIALALTATMTLSPAVRASWALGTEIHRVTVPLAQGTEMTKQSLWSATYSDLRTERYLTYTPTAGVRPAVGYGDKITSRVTLADMAKTLESQGKRVLGGLNGDYYVLSSGVPLGMVISNGVLRSTPQYTNSWSLGFQTDGTAFISQPELSVTANFKGMTLAVSGGINKARTVQGGYYLLTDEFADSTLNTQPGVDVVLRPLKENLGETVEVNLKVTQTEGDAPAPAAEPGTELPVAGSEELTPEDVAPMADGDPETVTATLTRTDELKIGSRVTCEVITVLNTTDKMEIPKGCYVLTINSKGNEWLVEQLNTLTPGERVEIDVVTQDTRWNQAETAIGGMYKLVTDSVVNEGLDKERAPRSAVGVRTDGSAVFYTIDGRQPGYSVGATLTQVAERLVELGCVEAVCLDGGGSTTFGVTWPGASAMAVTNSPSDGAQRANSNALFLVSDLKPTNQLSHFYVSPVDNLLLAGSGVQMYATAMDTNYLPMAWSGDVAWSVKSGDGTVTADGLFTAGSTGAAATVTAASNGGVVGQAAITMVQTPDVLRLVDEATGAEVTELLLEPNQTVDLKGVSTYRNLPVTSQDVSYVWTVDPAAGTVDQNGLFTAAAASGKGNLTVSVGGVTVTVPVSVTGHILALEDFEQGVENLLDTDTAQGVAETDLEYVRFGRGSAKMMYDAASGAATLAAAFPVDAAERFLSLWVYGDESGNTLMATAADADGNLTDMVLTGLDFKGWKRVMVELPAGTVGLRNLSVIYGGAGPVSGVIWLDQLTTANERVTDEEQPDVVLEAENGFLTATVTDAMDKKLQQRNITVLLDGDPLTFTWNAATAKVTAALPMGDNKIHRVSVTAADASGNRVRRGIIYGGGDTADWQEPFQDMTGHWAQGYTAYLWQEGIINGVENEQGTFFQPEKAISRGEFALMVARWQGLDLTAYGDVELPFADRDAVPDWMLPAIRAMYAEGVMKGSLEGENLYVKAETGISRMEAMTILGRIQAKGYPTAPLTFEDAGEVPAWALDYVSTLVTQGVVGGYENKLKPADPVKRCEVVKMLVTLM